MSERRARTQARPALASSPAMDDVVLRAAVAALVDGRRHPIADAVETVPDLAGLYAVYGEGEVRNTLALGSSDIPLYVGMAERSSRDGRDDDEDQVDPVHAPVRDGVADTYRGHELEGAQERGEASARSSGGPELIAINGAARGSTQPAFRLSGSAMV